MRISAIASFSTACFAHRIIWPFKYLAKDYPHHEFRVSTADSADNFDAIWLYGTLRNLSAWANVATLKRKRKKVIWTIDDDNWNFPEWRKDTPKEDDIGSCNIAAELADLIVTSTPALANVVGKPLKTVVAPNLLEVERYQTPTPPTDDGPVRIAWIGGGGHWGDLQLIDGACCRIKEKYGDAAQFHFLGDIPDMVARDWLGNGVTLTEWYNLNEHWWRLNQVRPHIVLAPSVDCAFNRSKSGIRCLEGWSLNAAVIASAVGEYRLIEDCQDGLFADGEEEWFDLMATLIGDRQSREQLAVAGYQRAVKEWNWNDKGSRQKWTATVEAVERLW